MSTFVLVHGGFTGGFLWREVRHRLAAAGHEVITPTLTGVGERVHLARPDIDLDTHIEDIVNVLRFEELDDVVLVGHSYSAMVVTGVTEHAPDRIRSLAYLDTCVPANGQSWLDLLTADFRDYIARIVEAEGDGWRIPMQDPDLPLSPHPVASVTQPLRIGNQAAKAVPRAFIHCSDKPDGWLFGLDRAIERHAEDARRAGWRVDELPTGHLPMLTMPAELAALLVSIADHTQTSR